jgi:hypothetical protein
VPEVFRFLKVLRHCFDRTLARKLSEGSGGTQGNWVNEILNVE